MAKKDEQKKINECYKLLNGSFNIKTNVIKVSVQNTVEHEMAKFLKAFELIKDGKTIITEAIFKNGGRADILNLSDMQVFEILHSETREEALRKEEYYPSALDIFYITSEEILNEWI